MSSSLDLVSMLQNALFEQQLAKAPVALRYISNFLLEDDEDSNCNLQVNQESYNQIFMELSSIIKSPRPPPSPPQDLRSSHIATQGTRILHPMLMQCAQALARSDIPVMLDIIKAVQQGTQSSRLHDQVALCFVDALIARLKGTGHQHRVSRSVGIPQAFANQIIYDRCVGVNRVHIVDYGVDRGQQWPPLIKAFSQRSGGPPQMTITAIDHPLYFRNETGQFLVNYAKSCGVDFVYEGISTDAWEDPSPFVWRTKDEVVIVQCLIKSCHIKEDSVHLHNPRKLWLQKIHKMKPTLFIQSENAVSVNSPFFLHRFQQTLNNILVEDMDSYCTSLHGTSQQVVEVAKPYIMNYVACDTGHLIRPASYKEWGNVVRKAGFESVQPSASVLRMLRSRVKQLGLLIEEKDQWLVVGCKDIDNYALCLWRPI